MTRTQQRLGFTIIELIVVVTIIIALIAIAIPALSGAKTAARKAETRSLLTALSTDIEAYFTTFNAYPGPATPTQTTATATKLSGTQNLLVALSYAMCATTDVAPNPPPSAPPAVAIPGTTLDVDPTSSTGPLDRSTQSPAAAYKLLSPFYTPAAKELSPSVSSGSQTWVAGGITGSASANTFAFPTILDRYPDALPILYYRKTPGVDATGTFTGADVSAQGTPPIVGTNPTAAVAAFYLNDNIEYTTATLTTPSGLQLTQSLSALDLATEIAANNNGAASSHGGYVLLSAGPNRAYGGGSKSDDLIVIGGQ